MRKSFVFTSLVAVFAFVAACSSESGGGGHGDFGGDFGGGGGGGGGDPSSGVLDPSRKISELSDPEAEQHCGELLRKQAPEQLSGEDERKSVCEAEAVITVLTSDPQSDEEAQATCRDAVAECLSEPPDTSPVGGEDEGREDEEDPCADAPDLAKECHVTIAELDRCFDDRAAANKAFVKKDLCAEIKQEFDPALLELEEPASCAAIADKCPSLVGGAHDGTDPDEQP